MGAHGDGDGFLREAKGKKMQMFCISLESYMHDTLKNLSI